MIRRKVLLIGTLFPILIFWKSRTSQPLPDQTLRGKWNTRNDLKQIFKQPVISLSREPYVHQYDLLYKDRFPQEVMYTEKFLPPFQDHIVGSPKEYQPFKALPEDNDYIGAYFNTLKTMTGNCRRLVRVGGNPVCRFSNVTEVVLDGHKFICLDPVFHVGTFTSRRENCLVLSFGVSYDVSFDDRIMNLNCDVHLFDILDFDPLKLGGEFEEHLHFHKIGLGKRNRKYILSKANYSMEVNKLGYLLSRFNLSDHLISVLKIDIEGQEWGSLEDMMKTNVLFQVGQIAMEVHTFDEVGNLAKGEKYFRKFTKILDQLEEIGFRRVSYADNVQPKRRVKDNKTGRIHESAGELLLVNSNWQEDPESMSTLRGSGRQHD